jgi:RimJ/RimL family protein N-acetyltransferase
MKDMELIKISQKDIPELRADARAVWMECYPGIISHEQIEYMLNWMYSEAAIRREIEHENINYYFIFHEGAKLGFCSLGPYPGRAGRAKLHKLYLYPEFHGKGFGSASLAKIFDLAREQGYDSICLNVNKNNRSAIKAYERNGFIVQTSVVNDIGNGYVMDDYVMLKEL